MPRELSPSSQSLRRPMPPSAGLVSLPNGGLTRDWPNSATRSNWHRGTRLRTIYWRLWLSILVDLKKQRGWHDKRSNVTHSLIKPGKAWPAFFSWRENWKRPKLQRGRQWNCSQPPRAAIGGRYLWRFSVAMGKRPCAKLNLSRTNATADSSLRLHTTRGGTASRQTQL